MKNKVVHRWLFLAAIFTFCFVCGQLIAAEFTADLSEQQGEMSKKGKIYVKGAKYTMEMTADGDKIIVIVDTEAKKTVVISVSGKFFKQMPIDDMTSVMNDPFQSYNYSAENGEEIKVAKETIDGFECEKYSVKMMDQEVISKWTALKLDFPIKIVAYGTPERIMTLSNIKEGDVADTRFDIPEGFTKWIDPESLPVEPPEWAKDIPLSPVLKTPFEHDMTAGDIARVSVEPGKSLKVKGKNKTEEEAIAKIIPFKDGRPLKKISWYNNFAMKGTICVMRHETIKEADEFVIYVEKGDLRVLGKYQDMTEKTVAEGEELRYKFVGSDNLKTRYVNLTEDGSEAVVNFFKEGVQFSEDEVGPVKYRTISLSEDKKFKESTMVAKGDEFVVTVNKGKMLVKLGQYDSFEF